MSIFPAKVKQKDDGENIFTVVKHFKTMSTHPKSMLARIM